MSDTSYTPITKNIPEYGDERMIQEWTAVYHALVEEIDDQIGLLLNTLEEHQQQHARDNTLIVFTSDHGEMLGSHGKRDKNNFFEESSRVPLIMSYPSKIPAATTVKDMVGHIDVFATILDYVSDGGSTTNSNSNSNDNDTTSNNNDNNTFENYNNDSDGTLLRPLIEGKETRKDYEDNFAVVEWDFRKPVHAGSTPSSGMEPDRRIDDRPAFSQQHPLA